MASVFRLAIQLISISAFYWLLTITGQAQSIHVNSVDSLIIQKNETSYYVRPLFEIQQFSTRLQSDDPNITEPRASMMRHMGIGIRLGYRTKSVEVETGLSSIWVGSGYQYRSEFDAGLHSRVRSTGYTHIPLTIRYRFWQPAQRLSLRAGISIAYNADLNKFPLAPSTVQAENIYSGSGIPTAVARISSTYIRKRTFWSGDINVSAFYQLSKRFGITIEAKRLISSRRIVTYDNVREIYKPARVQQFNGVSGANGYVVSVGLSYQFGFMNQYRLKNE